MTQKIQVVVVKCERSHRFTYFTNSYTHYTRIYSIPVRHIDVLEFFIILSIPIVDRLKILYYFLNVTFPFNYPSVTLRSNPWTLQGSSFHYVNGFFFKKRPAKIKCFISLFIRYRYLLRMLPPDSKQSEALVEFIRYFRWDTMALLTDNTDYGRKTVTSLSLDSMKTGDPNTPWNRDTKKDKTWDNFI